MIATYVLLVAATPLLLFPGGWRTLALLLLPLVWIGNRLATGRLIRCTGRFEGNVEEAVTNNILGTQCVLEAAVKHNVARFLLISTDKAVNPHSAMGASKRVAEMLAQDAARRAGGVFVAVRFGNVLGSRGSVVKLFQEQIANGGPITITNDILKKLSLVGKDLSDFSLETVKMFYDNAQRAGYKL